MTIARRNVGSGHVYTIDGKKVPGVTTILRDAMPKGEALTNWAVDTTAAYAVDRWAELDELKPSERLNRLKRARWDDLKSAGAKGTDVHALAERLLAEEEVEVPEHLAGHVEQYLGFLEVSGFEPVATEVVVGNRTVGYCGTFDAVGTIGGEVWLIDWKTGKRIYREVPLQCCAYARAEVYLHPDGTEHPMAELGIERVGAVLIHADVWELPELEVGEPVWAMFRHLAWLHRHLEDANGWEGSGLDWARAAPLAQAMRAKREAS